MTAWPARSIYACRIIRSVLYSRDSYADKDTDGLSGVFRVKRFESIAHAAQIKLAILNAAASLDDLTTPAGNRLERLKGDRVGQFSIRINDQYRICFKWKNGSANEVEIVDYH